MRARRCTACLRYGPAQVLPTPERNSILTRVAAQWAATGRPDNVAERVLAFQAAPERWTELLDHRQTVPAPGNAADP